MATKGLSTFLYATLDEKAGTYGTVAKLAGAITFKETLNKSSDPVYADNVKKWEDTSVTGGKLALGVDDDDPKIFAPLLGRKTRKVIVGEAEEEVYVGNSADIAEPVGFGLIEFGRNESGNYYQLNFYPKVTFAPYDKDGETKKENSNYKMPSVEGTIYNRVNGDYKYENRNTSLVDAVKVLYALFGVQEVPAEVMANIQSEATAVEAATE